MSGLLLTSFLCIAAPSHVVGVQQRMIGGSNAANFQENGPKKDCRPPGQLYFAHIMKDGGESVNGYLECLCDKHKCSVVHNEGPVHYKDGDQSCEPSICTSHGMVDQKAESCGSSFKSAPVFTVMRSPVSRIVSLYHYHRDMGHDFCIRNSLLQVLQVVEKKQKLKGAHIDHEWSDAMVDWYFANGEVISLVHGDESEKLAKMPSAMNGEMQSATGHDLAEAKEILKGFNAIFFTDDLDVFPKLFAKSDLPFSHSQPLTCELEHVGAGSNYPDPSKKELELIYKLNWADIELYEYAKTLPNQIS